MNIAEKISKLLALADSERNLGHESAAATCGALATKLLLEHGLTMAEIAAREEEGGGRQLGHKDAANVPNARWRTMLAAFVGEASGCFVARVQATTIVRFYGRPHAVDAAVSLLAWLTAQVERWSKDRAAAGSERKAYRLGMVATIGRRLSEAREATLDLADVERPQAAIVVRGATAEAREYARSQSSFRTNKARRLTADSEAFERGSRDGHKVATSPDQRGLVGRG